jgi:hypothetical protein
MADVDQVNPDARPSIIQIDVPTANIKHQSCEHFLVFKEGQGIRM